MALIRFENEILTITSEPGLSAEFAPHYVMVNGAYDNTLVGPFNSFSQALKWADIPHHHDFDTHILTQLEMEANIREYGDIYYFSPTEFEAEMLPVETEEKEEQS